MLYPTELRARVVLLQSPVVAYKGTVPLAQKLPADYPRHAGYDNGDCPLLARRPCVRAALFRAGGGAGDEVVDQGE